MTDTFILEPPKAPWGDYGNILVHGMSGHRERLDGEIQLERTGPFIPPLSFPGLGDIVITTPFRKKLEASGLGGFELRPVVKAHIVELNWHKWDRSAPEPKQYPPGGGPEAYILGKSHSESVSAILGSLWEVVLRTSAKVERVTTPLGGDIRLVQSSIPSDDFFRADGVLYNYVSARARAWLEANAREWSSFRPVLVA